MDHPLYDVCMLGMGPVGTVSGLCFAKQGFRVVGVDINPARLAAFASGKAPFVEEGVDTLLQECMQRELFHVTGNAHEAIASSRIIMIAVGTPTPEETGIPDLSQLDAVATTIGEAIRSVKHQPVIVVRSTVPPGTMRQRIAPAIAAASNKKAGEGFHIASNPEFLREGKAIADFFHTGRVVIGADSQEVAEMIATLYKDVTGKRKIVALESAEFAKYVDNSWHAVKVTFANEIARVCEAFGGNPQETADIFLSDDQLNISPYYLRPGFAFGGSCLPKDTRGLVALAKQHEVRVPMLSHVLESNEAHIDKAVGIILSHQPQQVGVLGCAFKEHVDDVRESPALMLVAKLKSHGIAVMAHDAAYAAGEVLSLPRDAGNLVLSPLPEIINQVSLMAVMHHLPLYETALKEYQGKVISLTTLPAINKKSI